MTVLIAYVSRARRLAFLGADDLEQHGQKRCDKVFSALNRFLIAGLGTDVAYHAARVVPALGPEHTLLRDSGR